MVIFHSYVHVYQRVITMPRWLDHVGAQIPSMPCSNAGLRLVLAIALMNLVTAIMVEGQG